MIDSTGLSQNKFAKSLNYTQSAISKITTGETYPSVDLLALIAEEYPVDLHHLICGNTLHFNISDPRFVVFLQYLEKHPKYRDHILTEFMLIWKKQLDQITQ